ncbi:MAG: hypothetical protein HYZ14_11800 [Bacteroidetes bacterium]|nr:hypothetical protein [Bacteroidota bacterium]
MIQKMISFFILLLLIVVSNGIYGQNFAQRCEGEWQGTMYIHQTYGDSLLTDSVVVAFTVTPFGGEAGYWIWNMEYLSEKTPVTKAYTLIQKSDTQFLLDEGDGIVLPNYVAGSKMYSTFEVDGTWLTASYEFVNETLVFEVTSGHVSEPYSKGEVTGYTIDVVQRVVLIRLP